jgi:hypothetical protein
MNLCFESISLRRLRISETRDAWRVGVNRRGSRREMSSGGESLPSLGVVLADELGNGGGDDEGARREESTDVPLDRDEVPEMSRRDEGRRDMDARGVWYTNVPGDGLTVLEPMASSSEK